MRIKVTQKNIDEGIKGSLKFCPIALAIKQQINIECEVMSYSIIMYDNCITLPIQATDFVRLFDRGKEVKPFSFELNID